MAQFKIRIIETLEKEVTISAADKKNALEIAEEKYSKAEDGFVLCADDFAGIEIKAVDE
jgi:hypothetical protein